MATKEYTGIVTFVTDDGKTVCKLENAEKMSTLTLDKDQVKDACKKYLGCTFHPYTSKNADWVWSQQNLDNGLISENLELRKELDEAKDSISYYRNTCIDFMHTNVELVGALLDSSPCFTATDIIYNDPATIIKWADGTKTVVKCSPDDKYDPDKGVALCYMKKIFGNKGKYNDVFKYWPCEDKKNKSGGGKKPDSTDQRKYSYNKEAKDIIIEIFDVSYPAYTSWIRTGVLKFHYLDDQVYPSYEDVDKFAHSKGEFFIKRWNEFKDYTTLGGKLLHDSDFAEFAEALHGEQEEAE